MSTVRELYKSYIQQSFYIRKPFFDAAIHEDFNFSTNRFLKGRLARPIQPRGKVWKKMLNDHITAQRRAHWGIAVREVALPAGRVRMEQSKSEVPR